MTGAEIFSTYLSKIGALFPCGHIRQHGFLFVTAVVWERPRLHKWGCNAHPCLFFSGPNPLLSPVGRPCAACKGKGTFSAKKTQSSSCSAPFMGSGYCRSAIASESVLHVAQHSACISGVGSMRSGTRNTGKPPVAPASRPLRESSNTAHCAGLCAPSFCMASRNVCGSGLLRVTSSPQTRTEK